MEKFKSHLFGILAFVLFPTFIIVIVLSVTFPQLILEPVGWLLNSSVEYDSYSSSYKPNQTATYFSYYMALPEGAYAEVSVIVVALLGSLIYAPLMMLTLSVVGMLLYIRSNYKEGFFAILAHICGKFRLLFRKPTFWIYFVPFVVAIGLIKVSATEETNKLLSSDLGDMLGVERLYQPMFATSGKDNELVVWDSYIYEKQSNLYTKTKTGFSKLFDGYIKIEAMDNKGHSRYLYTKENGTAAHINQVDRYVVIKNAGNPHDVIVIDTLNMKIVDIDFQRFAKELNSKFGKLADVKSHHIPHVYKLSDQFGLEVKFDLASYLNLDVAVKRLPSVYKKSIKGMNNSVKNLVVRSGNKKYKSNRLIDPKIVTKTKDSIFVLAKSQVGMNDHDIIMSLSHDLKLNWQHSRGSYSHYIKRLEAFSCDRLTINEGADFVTINYMSGFNACASEILDSEKGSLRRVYAAGQKI